MHTLGYRFKPWCEAKAIADGASILKYVKETAAEYGVDQHIRYAHLATKAEWSSQAAAWTVEALAPGHREDRPLYLQPPVHVFRVYSYRHGYTPEFEALNALRDTDPSPAVARDLGLQGQTRGGHWFRRNRDDARAGDGGRTPPISSCCSGRRPT